MGGSEYFQFSKHLNVLIKPSDGCNLRCVYCFHQDYGYAPNSMKEDVLDRFCVITFPHYNCISVVWHGGEPTFVGLDQFKRYEEIIKYYSKKYSVNLKQSIQTNGVLLTEEFVTFLSHNDISIGISYDGPTNSISRGSTDAFFRTKKLLEKNKVHFGVISVISKLNVNHLIELYTHMNEQSIPFQMNHYISVPGADENRLGLSVDDISENYSLLFDYWYNDELCHISVEPFMRIIKDIKTNQISVCSRASCLYNWCCLDVDGKILPCDRDFPDEYLYGSVCAMNDFREIYSSKGFHSLVEKAVIRRRACKADCDIFKFCNGGCNNNALLETGIENNNGVSCKINKWMIHFIMEKIETLELFNQNKTHPNPVLNSYLHFLLKENSK